MGALLAFLLISHAGAEKRDLPEVGVHYRLFTFEKNENPQNVMIVYTRVDEHCHFALTDGKPIVDFYWMMDRRRFKATNPLIKSRVRRQLRVQPVGADEFHLELDEVRELHVQEPRFVVRATRDALACTVRTTFESEEGAIAVDSLYSESRKTLLPPFRKLVSVTVNGRDQTQAEVHRKYPR